MKLAMLLALSMISTAFSEVLDFSFPEHMESEELATHIINEDPEVVQISKVSTARANKLYVHLKKDYENFVYIPTTSLFIASKKSVLLLPKQSRDSHDNNKGGGSFETGVDITWENGQIRCETYVQGEVHDKNGNYGEFTFTQKDTGQSHLNICGGNDKESK